MQGIIFFDLDLSLLMKPYGDFDCQLLEFTALKERTIQPAMAVAVVTTPLRVNTNRIDPLFA